jgi:pimeloyl-ACP methyl ester carboxylesterase
MHSVLYLHGFASSPHSRKAAWFGERLRGEGWEVRVPELDCGDFAHLTLTSQLRLIEREAGEGPVSLIGSSLGGYLAALYAARQPKVERLVLMAPAFGFARRWQVWLGEAAVDEWRRTGWLSVPHYSTGREMELGWQFLQDALRYEEEPAVEQPVLIFHGRGDEVVPVEASRGFAAGRRNVRLLEVDSGHDLLNVLDLMWSETRRFLER